MDESRLFWPMKIGNVNVTHRIGMPSLTRLRATNDRIPSQMMKEYYIQRASVPGTLIMSEGTFIAPNCGGFSNAPGIWSKAQIDAWREITDAVHRNGCFIFCQLFAMGRAADANIAAREGSQILAPSAIPIDDTAAIPQPMTVHEIKETIQNFKVAAKNAISAGFDGVECHAANGYLIDQFIQDVSNQRTDEYGGSVENRSRFVAEVLQALTEAVGPERVGLRLSPWSTFQGMRMRDPIPQFSDVIKRANRAKIAYLHLVESRVAGADDSQATDRLDFAFRLFSGPFLVAGGYTPDDARKLVDVEHPELPIMVMFGRLFISNPDLVFRIQERLNVTTYDRSTFYISESSTGYTDYKYSNEFLASRSR